jgi:gas vesicle protein
MQNTQQNDERDKLEVKIQRVSPMWRLTWLIAGLGIGAVAGVLLAPQSGEDTREWISDKYDDGIHTARAKAKRMRRRVGDWIDQGQERVTDAVNAGGDALKKAVNEVGT